jgi:hypothetical protein
MLVMPRHKKKAPAQAQGGAGIFPPAARFDLIHSEIPAASTSGSAQGERAIMENSAEVVI